MTFSTFIQVMRNIVVYWPYSEEGRVNCFATFKDRSDILHSTFGRTYADYLQGYFWSRPWVLSGGARNTMERSFGAIVLEHKQGDVIDASLGLVEQRIFVNSIQMVEQNGVILTEDELAMSNQRVLLSFIAVIDSTFQYRVTPTTGSPYSAWLTPIHAELLALDPGVTSVDQEGVPLYKFISNWGGQSIVQNYFGIEEQRSSMTELRVKTCDLPEENFNYNQEAAPDALAYVVKCD